MTSRKNLTKAVIWLVSFLIFVTAFLIPAQNAEALSVKPATWNVIGLDSNSPASGPNHFPVGAKVCGGIQGQTVTANFHWDTGGNDNGTYIYLRPGTSSSVNISFGPDGCADAFFEVEISKTSAAFGKTRRYYISVGSDTTPRPRELFVERLISQGRNYVTNIELNGLSVPPGGAMNLVVGNTYTLKLYGGTATQGYNQFEMFINLSNTIFQILSVSTNYSANNSPYVSTTGHKYLYADACLWEGDPNSPYYNSCYYDYKSGGTNVVTTYVIKIVSGGGSSVTLGTLLYDFSGASYHYNADFTASGRIANIIDPATLTISKSFSPNPTNVGGYSNLTITIRNPNAGAIGGVTFTDIFPTSPGNMTLGSTSVTNSCGGTVTDQNNNPLAIGSTGIKLNNGTVGANGSCNIIVSITTNATGTYTNTSGNLYVGTTDTGSYAQASLTVNTTPPPPPPPAACANPVTIAAWNFDNLTAGANTAPAFSYKAADVSTATAQYTGGVTPGCNASNITTAQSQTSPNSWATSGYTTAPTAYSSTAAYLDFTLDTSKYGGVGMSFYSRIIPGSWGGTNRLYLWSRADGGSFSNLLNHSPLPTAWTAFPATGIYTATTTGISTTTFRINAAGSKSSQCASSILYIDTVTIRGCPTPDPPNISKSFSPSTVAVGAPSTLTFTIQNTNTSSNLTGLSFTDNLPYNNMQGTVSVTNGNPIVNGTGTAFKSQVAANSVIFIANNPYTVSTVNSDTQLTLTSNYTGATQSGLTISAGVTATSVASNTCGGTLSITSGGRVVSLTGGTVNVSSSCTISLNVRDSLAGTLTNVSEKVSSTESGTNNGSSGVATATITAVLPPYITKVFSPNEVIASDVSTIIFTIINPNQNSSISGVSFTDTFPDGMVVANPANASTSGCGTPTYSPVAWADSISFSNGTISAGGTCIVKVNIVAPSSQGNYTNTTSFVSHTVNAVSYNGNQDSDTLTVRPTYPSISIIKFVSTSPTGPWRTYTPVSTGSNVYYRFAVENTGDVNLSNVYINDSHLGSNICSWMTLNKYDEVECTYGPVAAQAGLNINVATVYASYGGNLYTDSASAAYATTGLTLIKSSQTAYFTSEGNSLTYSYIVKNTGYAPLKGPVTVADDKVTVNCPPVSSAVLQSDGTTLGDGDNYLDGNYIPANAEQLTCTAVYIVSAGDVTAKLITNQATALIDGVTSNTVSHTIYLAPSLTKAFNPSTITVGGTSTLTFTITNHAGAPARSGLGFADTFPANLMIADPANVVNNCGGSPTITAAPGTGVFTVGGSGVNASAGDSACTISVNVTSSIAGSYVNGAGQIATTTLHNGVTDQTLNVTAAPSLTVLKSAQVISDPLNGSTNPKAIPGSEVLYTIIVTNTSAGLVDNDTLVVTDSIPTNMSICVSTTCSNPPVAFSCSSEPPCGLTYNYAADVAYSNQIGGAEPYNYTLMPDAEGYDINVTGVRINPKGPLNGSNANFSIFLKMKVK